MNFRYDYSVDLEVEQDVIDWIKEEQSNGELDYVTILPKEYSVRICDEKSNH